jgi:hypothetical protein
MITIAVVNRSKDVGDAQARAMARTCQLQVEKHVAPLYAFVPWPVRLYKREKDVPQDALLIVLLEDEKGADALGYHDETPQGRRYGRVFTRPILEDPEGSVHTTPYSVSTILSHEVLEAFVDPDCNIWAEGKPGQMYAYEACDPVQEDAYRMVVDGHRMYVSNFVLPTWFDLEYPAGTRFDYMRRVKKPFKMTAGGYAIFWDGGSSEKILWGRRTRRSHRQGVKNFPAARSYRRTGGRVTFESTRRKA